MASLRAKVALPDEKLVSGLAIEYAATASQLRLKRSGGQEVARIGLTADEAAALKAALPGASPTPEPTPTPTPTPTPDPPKGVIVPAGSDIGAFIRGRQSPGMTFVLGPGNHSQSGGFRVDASELTLACAEGAVYRGGRIEWFGNKMGFDRMVINQPSGISGKDIEFIGDDCFLRRSDLTNNFGGIKVQARGDHFIDEDNFYHQIGRSGLSNIFDHAFYGLNGRYAIHRRNRYTEVLGGYGCHAYDNWDDCKVEPTAASGIRMPGWRRVKASVQSERMQVRRCAMQWDLGQSHEAPNGRTSNAGAGTRIEQSVCWAPGNQFGDDGIDEDNLTKSNIGVINPQFRNPKAGDFTIQNAEARAHLGLA